MVAGKPGKAQEGLGKAGIGSLSTSDSPHIERTPTMDQMHLLLWSQRMTTQAERSRDAHMRYIRAEQVRQAQAARPGVTSVLARAWQALAGKSRGSVERGELATQP
jgi:hypothetical protein